MREFVVEYNVGEVKSHLTYDLKAIRRSEMGCHCRF